MNNPQWMPNYSFSANKNQSNMNTLPTKWCISRNLTSEQNTTVTDWINKRFNTNYSSYRFETCYKIGNTHGQDSFPNAINEGYTEINYQEFEQFVLNNNTMKQLPEQYAVKCNSVAEINEVMLSVYGKEDYINTSFKFVQIKSEFNGNHLYDWSDENYPEIPFAEWKQLFKNNEKKIIGYNLIKPEYTEAALKLINYTACFGREKGGKADVMVDKNIEIFRKAGVLDIWFSPVYEQIKIELPEINGYKGEYKNGIVKYGCVEFSERWWKALWGGMNPVIDTKTNRKIVSVKLDSGVEITKDHCKQVVDFIKNN